MAFLQWFTDYLRDISRPIPEMSAARVRNQLMEALERVEAKLPGGATQLGEKLRDWQQQDRVVRFAHRLAELLRQSFGARASDEQIIDWVGVAIARQVGLSDTLPSRVQSIELDRLAEQALADVTHHPERSIDVAAYAAQIRAVRKRGEGVELTPIARVFLELTGRDAARWLLHVEAEQSLGPSDPWRLSQVTARRLVHETRWTFRDDADVPEPPGSWPVLRRLASMGLIEITEDEYQESGITWIEVLPVGQALFDEIAQARETPLQGLAQTLLADLTLGVATQVKAGERIDTAAAAEATARQARMVAHEIRNALVPVQITLRKLYREVEVEPAAQVLARRQPSIDHGIHDVLRFVGQLVDLARLTTRPSEPLDLLAILRDALAAVAMPGAVHVDLQLPATLPPVTGHRARLLTGLVNLLRNAVQHGGDRLTHIQIAATVIDSGRAVLVAVDDDGPGVAEPLRQLIFDEGVSLSGGTGLGLALVRDVVEREMRGLVNCEASSLGGARFVLRLPAAGVAP